MCLESVNILLILLTQDGKGCESILSGVISKVQSLDFYPEGPIIIIHLLRKKRDPCQRNCKEFILVPNGLLTQEKETRGR